MNARRYGGKYSPGGPGDQPPAPAPARGAKFRGRKAERVSLGALALFFAALPLLFAGFGEIMRGAPFAAATELGAYALITLGAWLLREGLKAQREYDSRKVARRPAIPRKLFAAGATGLGVFVASWFGWGLGFLPGLVFGLLAGGGLMLAYGPDPMRSKGIEGLDAAELDRAAEAIARAEAQIAETEAAAARFGDRGLEERVDRIAAAARELFREIENDPGDIRRARKFLTVYIAGARDAAVKFAETYPKTRDYDTRRKFDALLDDLEKSFGKQKQVLLLDDRTALDVEIEVLQERLQQEGLR